MYAAHESNFSNMLCSETRSCLRLTSTLWPRLNSSCAMGADTAQCDRNGCGAKATLSGCCARGGGVSDVPEVNEVKLANVRARSARSSSNCRSCRLRMYRKSVAVHESDGCADLQPVQRFCRPHSIYDSSTVGGVGISAATSLLANC